MPGMTALLLPFVIARTVVTPEDLSDGPVSVDFGLSATDAERDVERLDRERPAIIVGADGELEMAEDSNLRVGDHHERKGHVAAPAERLHPVHPKPVEPRPHHEHAGIAHSVKHGPTPTHAAPAHGGIAHNVHHVHQDEGHMRTNHAHRTKAKHKAISHVVTGVPIARGFVGMGISSIVMISGFLIAQYVMNVARCTPPSEQELDNKAEMASCVSPTSRVARLLPCQCSRRNQPEITVAAFAKKSLQAELKGKKGMKGMKGKGGKIELPADHSESSLASAEAGYDIDRARYKLPPLEEKEPEPEHEDAESELGPKLEGATSYVLRVVKARVEGIQAEKKPSLAWTISSEGQDPPPRPSRFNKDQVWDAPVDKVDLDISDPNVGISVAVLAAADNPIEPPSPVAWATITASNLLAEGSGNRPKAKNLKKDTMYVHTKEIPLEPSGCMRLEYSIIAFFHWVVP